MHNQSDRQEKRVGFLSIFDKVEPIAITTIIFLFIGGSHQIYSLYKIGYPYIRFFSSTQLISDSISFLLIFIIKIVFPIIVGGIFHVIVYIHFPKLHTILFFILVGSFTLVSLVIVYRLNRSYFDLEMKPMSLFFISGTLLAKIYSLYSNIYNESNFEQYMKLCSYVFLIIFQFYSNSGFSFGKYSALPDELENYQNIHKKYKSKGIKDSVLYFNDNYIFVELKKDTISLLRQKRTIRKVQILKFDNFFEEDPK